MKLSQILLTGAILAVGSIEAAPTPQIPGLDPLLSPFTSGLNTLTGTAVSLLNPVSQALGNIGGGISQGISNAIGNLGSVVGNIFGTGAGQPMMYTVNQIPPSQNAALGNSQASLNVAPPINISAPPKTQ